MTPGTRAALLLAVTAFALGGCVSKAPAAAEPRPKPANSKLEHCPRTLGTLRIVEEAWQPWLARLDSDFQLPSTLPLLRLMVRQSNCFILVEPARNKGAAPSERPLSDYTAIPSISFGERGGGARIGPLSEPAWRARQASTLLLLTDNHSGVELAAAEGSAGNWEFGAAGGFFNGGFAGAAGYTGTPQGKVLVAAFMDSYNQLVRSLKRRPAPTLADGSLRMRQAQRPNRPDSE